MKKTTITMIAAVAMCAAIASQAGSFGQRWNGRSRVISSKTTHVKRHYDSWGNRHHVNNRDAWRPGRVSKTVTVSYGPGYHQRSSVIRERGNPWGSKRKVVVHHSTNRRNPLRPVAGLIRSIGRLID